jgi:MoaA/NifB/PqqE/SkfB family radical SAM enzyme
MKNTPLPLPWTPENVPHAVLDILRGCNIRCRDCYNLQPDHVKSLSEIDAQLDSLIRLRKLQSISIVGGEPTLHPDLVEIVRRVRRRGLFVELFTNGVDLNDQLLAGLKRAGTNVIFLHIEPNQRRPDLPAESAADELRRLRAEKSALVAAHGIEVGLAVTAYPDKPE